MMRLHNKFILKAIILLAVLCIYDICTAQPFVKVIKKAGEQVIRSRAAEHYDGGYIVVENDMGINNYIRKYSQNGVQLWQKRLKGGKNGDYTRNLRITKDSGIIAVGCTYKYYVNSDDESDAVIVRYDKCGNVVWKKILVSDTAYLATECIELGNGDIVVLTLYPEIAYNKYYAATMLFSPQGKLKAYRANNFEHLYLDLSEDSNYFYAMGAAWFMSPVDSYYYRFPAISKFRCDNLNIIQQIPSAFDSYVGLAGSILSEKDPMNIKAIGSVATDGSYLSLFDVEVPNKKVGLLKNYTPKGLTIQGGDGLVSPSRDYVVTTEWADTFNKQTNKTTRLLDIRVWDTLNNMQYHARPSGYKWDLSTSIILRDKRILVTGAVWDSANQFTDSYFLRFKPDLSWDSFRTDTTHYDFACGTPPTSEDITFTAADSIHIDNDSYDPANTNTNIGVLPDPVILTCWPNPAHNELFVGIAGETKDYNMFLYDMEGRLLSYPTAQSYNCYLFNTSNLSTGVYIIQILHKYDGTTARYKFVKD